MLKPEIDSLVPHVPFNRRTFIKAALGTGFAAAVMPVSAQTIHTDSDGLEAGEIARALGRHAGARVSRAAQGQDAFAGDHRRSTRFSACTSISPTSAAVSPSWVIWPIAPNLYEREGDRSVLPSMQQLNEQLVSKVPDEQVLADLDATVAWAGEHGGDLNRLGVNGFCWGGRIAWLYAEHNPRHEGGRGLVWPRDGRQERPMTPANPLDQVRRLHAPVLGCTACRTRASRKTRSQQMKQAIARVRRSARGSQFVVYDDAGHAFFADYRPSYQEGRRRRRLAPCAGVVQAARRA